MIIINSKLTTMLEQPLKRMTGKIIKKRNRKLKLKLRKRRLLRNLMQQKSKRRGKNITITFIDHHPNKILISQMISGSSMICRRGHLGLEKIHIGFLLSRSRSRSSIRISNCKHHFHQLKKK